MRFRRLTCQLDGNKSRKGKKCPRCRRFHCAQCLDDLVEIMGTTIKCVYCGTIVVSPPPPKPQPKPKRRTFFQRDQPTRARYTPITMQELRQRTEWVQGRRVVGASGKLRKILEHCTERPSSIDGVMMAVEWERGEDGRRIFPSKGALWYMLNKLVDRGKLRRKLFGNTIIYGPPEPSPNFDDNVPNHDLIDAMEMARKLQEKGWT